MVVITGENPPASSLYLYSDDDGIFGLATVSDYTRQCVESVLF